MALGALFLSWICVPAGAQLDIQVTGGSWWLTLDDTDLVGAPGSDLTDHYRSHKHDSVTTSIDVINTTGAWTVDVRRTGALPAGWKLKVKRTNSGTGGTGVITGGTTYMNISGGDRLFFQCVGGGDCTGIVIQYRLRNVTIGAGLTAGTYTTTITYTVSDAA